MEPLEVMAVRQHPLSVSATLAGAMLAVLAAACGGGSSATSSTPGAGCVNGKAAHRAYVVVTHLSGTSVERCVGFDGDSVTGDVAMQESGIELQTQQYSFGKAVCQLDNEPKQFTECLPKDQPYWALYSESAGGSWAQAQSGYTDLKLKDGDAMGWRYTPVTASPAPLPSPPRK